MAGLAPPRAVSGVLTMGSAQGGLWMLLALGLLVMTTGLPVWALLLGVSSVAAVVGWGFGVVDAGVLAALPARLTGLLESDLLQALPLYVFVGVLLQRVTLADALYAGASRGLAPWRAGPAGGVLGVGLLVAPMNGSVASSSSLLARLVWPVLARTPLRRPERATALIAVAATLGVVLPPSLVLLLLGDALMRAHTEALQLHPERPWAGGHVLNTQDLLHAAALPAGLVLLGWLAVAVWQWRGAGAAVADDAAEPRRPASQQALAALSAAVILALLAGVFTGRLLAVEAAATGGVLLAVGTVAARALDRAGWQQVLDDTLALSGALIALLVGATTFSLVFRLWGSDVWLSQWAVGAAGNPRAVAVLLLAGVGLCAWVLDAFEMIFVIIPLVAPALIDRLGDAQQAGVLLLLVLQASFLWPPMGYAVMLARLQGPSIGTGALWRALAPYLLVQALCIVGVFCWPASVHGLDEGAAAQASGAAPAASAPMSEDDIEARMRAMSGNPP